MWREDTEEWRENCKYRSQTVYQGNNHAELNRSTQNNSLVCTVRVEEAENHLAASVFAAHMSCNFMRACLLWIC